MQIWNCKNVCQIITAMMDGILKEEKNDINHKTNGRWVCHLSFVATFSLDKVSLFTNFHHFLDIRGRQLHTTLTNFLFERPCFRIDHLDVKCINKHEVFRHGLRYVRSPTYLLLYLMYGL